MEGGGVRILPLNEFRGILRAISLNNLRVLLATGMERLDKSIAEALGKRGKYEVAGECYYREGLTLLLREKSAGVVILSPHLPGQTELSALIRDLRMAGVRVLLLPGSREDKDAVELTRKAVALGAYDTVWDPVSPEKIVYRLESPAGLKDAGAEPDPATVEWGPPSAPARENASLWRGMSFFKKRRKAEKKPLSGEGSVAPGIPDREKEPETVPLKTNGRRGIFRRLRGERLNGPHVLTPNGLVSVEDPRGANAEAVFIPASWKPSDIEALRRDIKHIPLVVVGTTSKKYLRAGADRCVKRITDDMLGEIRQMNKKPNEAETDAPTGCYVQRFWDERKIPGERVAFPEEASGERQAGAVNNPPQKAPLSYWLARFPTVLPEKRVGRLLAVYSSASGVGKTAVSVTTAALLAGRGCRVCLVDADPTGHTLTEHFAGLSAGRYVFEAVRPRGWTFDLVPGPVSPSDYSRDSARMVMALRDRYDFMIVDFCPGTLEVYEHIKEYLAAADYIWLLCTPEAKAVGAVKRFAMGEGRLVPSLEEKLTFVVNRSYPLAPRKPVEVAAATGFPLGAVLPEDSFVELLFTGARPPRPGERADFLDAVDRLAGGLKTEKGEDVIESQSHIWQRRPGLHVLEGARR